MGKISAVLLILSATALNSVAGDSAVDRKFQLLRQRLDTEERQGLLRAARQFAGRRRKGAPRGAGPEVPVSGNDTRGSRIMEVAPLPDPDVASIRLALGLEQRRNSARTAIARRAADAPPVAADLAESDAVLLTPEIRRLAQQLGSANRIYAYVRDHVEYSLYFGAKQNSLAVLLSGRANNVDTATLLIALLRASGTPARYGQAQVSATIDEVAAWIGARKPAAVEAMATVPLLASIRDSNVEFYHVWTEAWLETPEGNEWVSMDASFKQLAYEPGIELPVQPFDMDEFLSTQRPSLLRISMWIAWWRT